MCILKIPYSDRLIEGKDFRPFIIMRVSKSNLIKVPTLSYTIRELYISIYKGFTLPERYPLAEDYPAAGKD